MGRFHPRVVTITGQLGQRNDQLQRAESVRRNSVPLAFDGGQIRLSSSILVSIFLMRRHHSFNLLLEAESWHADCIPDKVGNARMKS